MKRFAGAVGATALMVTLAASEPPLGGTAEPVVAADVSTFLAAAAEPTTLVVEPVVGAEDEVAAAFTVAGHPILRTAGGVFEVPGYAAYAGFPAAPGAPVDPASLALLPGVASVAPAERAIASAVTTQALVPSARTGATGGEGADAIGVPAWRAAYLTGRGTRLGVIDTGFGQWDEAAAAGDVSPMTFDPARDLDLCDDGFEHTNHGTASSEILYDVAPGVELFRVCIDDAVDLAEAVPWLIAGRVDVVNMSLGFYNTARGDGQGGPRSPDQSVRQAIDAGILWVNSAGNEAQLHWGGPFTDADADGRHEWVAGEPTMSFTLPPKAPVTVYLKWDEWATPTDDFALCLATTAGGTRDCYPGNALTKGTPTVSVGLTNPFDREVTLYASVQRVSGTGTPRLDAFFLGAGQVQHPVPASSLAEPAAVPGVVSVGAVCTRSETIRPYSSEGPTLDGRIGITVVAPGSISSLVAGPATDCQGGYGGTSAAAPHVAGSLALINQGLPYATPKGVLQELIERTGDAGDPGAAGPDPVYGHGVLKLGRPDTLTSSPNGTTTTTTGTSTSTTQPGEPPTTSTTGGTTTTSTTVPPTSTTGAPGTAVPDTTTTTDPAGPPSGGYGLGVSNRADRSDPRPLAGETLSGDGYVFVTPVWPAVAPDVVRFSVDGRLVQVERFSGFDLGGGTGAFAYPFDTFRLGDGDHVLEARLRFADGHDEILRAPFRVDNRGRTAPERPFQLVVAADPGGTGSRALEGAAVSGPLYLGVVGDAPVPVDHVLFYVDAGLSGYDRDAPYSLGPVDASALGPGDHMSQVIAYLTDGRIITVNATFTVG